MKKLPNKKNTHFYYVFGVLTSAFSRLEADLRLLIAGLAFRGEAVVASAFMDGSQLGENLKILRKLGRQYWEAEDRIKEIAILTERIRERRNLFVHGLWSPGTFGEKDGLATVQDLKTSFEETGRMKRWKHGLTEKFSIQDFQRILDEVNTICAKIEEACEWFAEHEDMDFSYFGGTSKSKPTLFRLNADGSFSSVKE